MDRRSFLLGTGATLLGQMLGGCERKNQAILSIQLLNGSIPSQLIAEFRQSLNQPVDLKLTLSEELKDLFAQLQSWSKPDSKKAQKGWQLSVPFMQSQPKSATDLIAIGDYWLASAIEQKLIQPLDAGKLRQWQQLPREWQKLVQRNEQGYLDAQGKVWAAPYSWGTTVIAYNRDKFQSLGWKPSDWSDLWRQEVRDRISLLDQPREVIGLALKKLGQSYNTENLQQVPNLKQELRTLNQQAKFYSLDTYLQPLILGDTWLAVGWSTDVLPVMQRYKQIAAVIPRSGTALWANLWVRPANINSSTSLSQQWIDFCWQPKIAQQISVFSKATSPIPVRLNPDDIPEGFRSLLLIEPQIFQRSEFLQPLSPSTIKQYQDLWQDIRQVQS